MKSDIRHPLVQRTAALGVIALLLRLGLTIFGTDEKGLLIPTHILAIGLWLVTAAALFLILFPIRKLDGSAKYQDNFAPDRTAALSTYLLAGGIALTVATGLRDPLRLDMIRNIAGILCIPVLAWIGICRRQGKQPFFLCYGLLCVYLILHAVSRYQTWSRQPQLLNYFFPMMGCILLTLFAYYQTAFCAGLGKRRMHLATGLLGIFFCLAALSSGQDPALHLTGAIWMAANLCRLTPVIPEEKTDEGD